MIGGRFEKSFRGEEGGGYGCVVEEHAVKLGKREGIAHFDDTYRPGLCARVWERP